MEKIGLIAGNRRFPLLVSQQAKKQGVSLIVAAIKNEASPEIGKFSPTVRWFSLGEFSRMFEFFKQEEVKKVIMAGQISPERLFSREVQNSPQIQELLTSIKDRKANSIFSGIAKKLPDYRMRVLLE